MLTVLYDGWGLIYQPYSPAAQHLLAILAQLPSQVQAYLALPGEAPAWLPAVASQVDPTGNTPTGRLAWEQHKLPRLARRLEAQLLHLTSLGAPLPGKPMSVASPGEYLEENSPPATTHRSLAERLRAALAQGGLARLRGLFWPADLPAPGLPLRVLNLPPTVHPAFSPEPLPGDDGAQSLAAIQARGVQDAPPLDLPEAYVLYQGSGSEADLRRLLAAWSWAADAIGGDHPLLLAGLDRNQRQLLDQQLAGYDLGGTVFPLPDLSPLALPQLYRRCTAFFSDGSLSPWGGPARHALACGKPVVGVESQLADAFFGPAAYLAPPGEARRLGAALITVVVEKAVAEQLAGAARQRAAGWQAGDYGAKLWEAYQAVLSATTSEA
jgi:hypothetical protein